MHALCEAAAYFGLQANPMPSPSLYAPRTQGQSQLTLGQIQQLGSVGVWAMMRGSCSTSRANTVYLSATSSQS
ncbi:hypothetical protein LX32DRAFT_639599 [Colletotrichum zoysiae]|uniref:Uncharacterized protein n=1 Tax=Colletotrichum zoysiae TaxID=1216348 RepID=A0AAD9HGQ9_9PEZI|nr:hypothetical protein LX32DRAFT_639599 [Colletotrichum zoysiae]